MDFFAKENRKISIVDAWLGYEYSSAVMVSILDFSKFSGKLIIRNILYININMITERYLAQHEILDGDFSHLYYYSFTYTAWIVFLVHVFPHSDQKKL